MLRNVCDRIQAFQCNNMHRFVNVFEIMCGYGSQYREVYRYYEKKLRGIQQSWLLVPLIFYVDKTFVDRSGRFTVEPLTFTSSIFTDTARGSHKFWRIMGMMQDPLAHLSAAQAKRMPKGATTRNYHKQLDVIFKPLVDVQTNVDKRLNSMEIKLGGLCTPM